jgi:hypothetical protein
MMKKRILILFLSLVILVSAKPLRNLALVRSFPDDNSTVPDDYLASPYKVVKFNDHFIVSDADSGCLKVFNNEGTFVRAIGRKGQGPGEFGNPYVFTIDKTCGIIYCFDSNNGRIAIFDFSGKFIGFIKTTLNIFDLIFVDGKLFLSAYNDVNKTLLVEMDREGKILKFFRLPLDEAVNRLPEKYRSYFYKAVTLDADANSIYAFFWYLPYIVEFNKSGEIKNTVKVDIKEAEAVYKKNLSAASQRSGARLDIKYWTKGASVKDDNFYFYSVSSPAGLMVVDHKGRLMERIGFKDKATAGLLMIYSGLMDGEHVFIDSNWVKIFKEE